MGRTRSRSGSRGKSRDREIRKARGKRDSRCRKRYRSLSKRDSRSRSYDRGSGNRKCRDLRSGSHDRQAESRDRNRRLSRGRARYRSRSVTRVRSGSPSRNNARGYRKSRSRSRHSPRNQERSTRNRRFPITRTPSPITLGLSNVNRSAGSNPPCSEASTLAHALMHAIKTMQPVRSQHYFISNFDPSINNINAWCEEVDRARDANGWSDHECLSRVASCLKGDAKVWLGEWVTNDRTWSNFKKEFTPLCPSKLDYANILFNVMNNTSDKYSTYAEYARRTLLRLRVIQGLSDELRTLIVIRGIDNPQVRAAAANADLSPDSLVSFLSIYAKPNRVRHDNLGTSKKIHQNTNTLPGPKCFSCGQRGHVSRDCKRPNSNANTNVLPSVSKICTFCKKPGHTEDTCFAKTRSADRNQRHINLCSFRPEVSQSNNVIDGRSTAEIDR